MNQQGQYEKEDEQGDPGQGGGDADPPGTEEVGPAPGLIERIREVWDNPAYRFVLLFLPYLGVVAVTYPLFVTARPRIVNGGSVTS